MIRRSSSYSSARINHIHRDPYEMDVRLFLHYGDLNDASSINRLGMPLEWHGGGEAETGMDRTSGRAMIWIASRCFRSAKVDLLGDPSKARQQLGWELKTDFDQLVELMVDADLKPVEREQRANG
ncbi:GDP-mannose 4,6-dehydratase [Geobacter sp. SVR]|uniref:GDP-mannose 4,6-dehydratase n=1 Tax=Geobacter sp. SVR TaxID=2495594 RepID=UPI00143EF5D7|nr:GDP-mannose 4,6-dehydratase [Geobacter sp. SVR]BCS51973.1 hypothetical protein GSVR_02810 [Geobacter sp. SVR]GCF87212.1 hypothetical protein GSbR_38120 [Geobacter sp. SVR]